jgi:hypothetical protein
MPLELLCPYAERLFLGKNDGTVQDRTSHAVRPYVESTGRQSDEPLTDAK